MNEAGSAVAGGGILELWKGETKEMREEVETADYRLLALAAPIVELSVAGIGCCACYIRSALPGYGG